MRIQPNFLAIINVTFFTVTILFGVAACNTNKANKEVYQEKSLAETNNDSLFKDSARARDAAFLEQAAIINLHEIGLGQLAKGKSSSPEVLVLSNMLIDHHTNATKEIKILADKKNIIVPISVESYPDEAINKLVKENKSTFDKSFINLIIEGHKNAIGIFESADSTTTDTEIKNYIALVMPALKQHLKEAEKILLNSK